MVGCGVEGRPEDGTDAACSLCFFLLLLWFVTCAESGQFGLSYLGTCFGGLPYS